MSEQKVAPYGSWTSPITADLIASATIALGQIALDDEDVYWAAEPGRAHDGRDAGPLQRAHPAAPLM